MKVSKVCKRITTLFQGSWKGLLILALVLTSIKSNSNELNNYKNIFFQNISDTLNKKGLKSDSITYKIHGNYVTRFKLDSILNIAIKETICTMKKKGFFIGRLNK